MSIRAKILAGVLLAGTALSSAAFAADTGSLSLSEAAKQGNRDVVRSLLNGPAKQDIARTEGTAALIWAATRNDGEMVDLLLRAGANAKAVNEYGASALYAAAANGDPAVTEKLLAAGADPNANLASGESALMEASRRGHLAVVRALLKGGETAVMWAISERHSAVTKALVDAGADVSAVSQNGSTALMFAAQGDAESARILLAAKANPNVAMKYGITPLIIASTMGKLDVVNALLDGGADPNMRDGNTFTALHSAVRDSDYGGDAALRTASVGIVKALLAHGADPNARIDQKKQTVRTLNEISFQGATPLVLAAEVNNLDAIKVLVEGGADPKIATEQGTTALMLAAGAGTDVQRARALDERALAVQTARYLVEHGVDVNAVGQFGWTALHCASYQGLNEVIEYLTSKGGNIDAKDQLGQTPLSISLSVLTKEAGARRLQIPRRFRGETAQLILKLGATPLNKSGVNVVLQRNGDLNIGVGQ
jgi:ankyrin repeat protein